jgi:hypothetical protein
MSMSNAVTTYSVLWIGYALSPVEWKWTMSKIFFVDSFVGILFLVILPFLVPNQARASDRRELID